jgi:hypothetical protein
MFGRGMTLQRRLQWLYIFAFDCFVMTTATWCNYSQLISSTFLGRDIFALMLVWMLSVLLCITGPIFSLRSYSGRYREDWGNQNAATEKTADFPADTFTLKLPTYPTTNRYCVSTPRSGVTNRNLWCCLLHFKFVTFWDKAPFILSVN